MEYKCDKCGMGVTGMKCAKCGKDLVHGTIDKDDAAFLQQIADETVREFFGRD